MIHHGSAVVDQIVTIGVADLGNYRATGTCQPQRATYKLEMQTGMYGVRPTMLYADREEECMRGTAY